MSSFSILICTYNPEPVIFQRLLNAVLQFNTASASHEVIIIDNNSSPALATRKEVQNFLEQKTFAKLITESTPGLTAARTAGIKAAQYEWVVFFDDDNEPAADYLTTADHVIQQYPQVGAWGPGSLQVEYYGKQESAFLKKIKWLFQQRDYTGTHIDNNSVEGSIYYPFGTGMIIRKAILQNYIQQISAGVFTMSDRKEKNLSSAGDLQMLFTCIKGGYYAGSTDQLQLKHLINAHKATPGYATRLVYALNSSQLKAYNEVFPERAYDIPLVQNKDVCRVLLIAIRSFRMHKNEYSLPLFISRKMGELNASVVASGKPKPLLLSVYEKWIKL